MSKLKFWEEHHAANPEPKLELIDGRLVVGNCLRGSRFLLHDIVEGWGTSAAIPFAPEARWWQALSTAFSFLGAPGPEHSPEEWRTWASRTAFDPRIEPAGPQTDGPHYTARERLMTGLTRVAGAGAFGRSLARDCVVRLGEDGVTPDVFLIGREQAERAYNCYFDGPPCLVIEILMPGHEAQDRVVKRQLYAAGGVAEYWVVDPARRAVDFLQLSGGGYSPGRPEEDGRYRPRSVPGLAFVPERLWEPRAHPNDYPELFLVEWPGPDGGMPAWREGMGWGHLPFAPLPDLTPRPLRFEEFISWCGRAKFENLTGKPLIDGTMGTRNVLGMLLRTFGLIEAALVRHPRQWIEGLVEAADARRHDAERKGKWWDVARRAATLLREAYGPLEIAVIGDLVRPQPLNLWSDISLVVGGLPKGGRWDAYDSLEELGRKPAINIIERDHATPGLQLALETEAIDL